ncbi:MAG: prolyl-tRNA synthetase associated domain-containing protein [Alphaproteobacteria bacterium]
MNDSRKRLFSRFDELGIEAPTVPYPAHRTVEEGKILRGDMAGTFTKNLLLKDKKGRLFLIVAHEDQNVDLRTLHTRVRASGRLGFVSADLMRAVLAVEPGALTPLALLNDVNCSVTVVVDVSLMDKCQLNFHPLVNTESTGIKPHDHLTFIASCQREATIIDLGNLPPQNATNNP